MFSPRRLGIVLGLLALVFTALVGLPRSGHTTRGFQRPSGLGMSPAESDVSDEVSAGRLHGSAAPDGGHSDSMATVLEQARHALIPVEGDAAGMPGNAGARWFAYNPGQQLAARFRDGSVRVGSEDGEASISRGSGAAGTIAARSGDNRIEYHHADGVVEWWVNRKEGIEQGFTVPQRPADGSEIRVPLRVENMTVAADPDRPSDLVFLDQRGIARMGYQKLEAWDAEGTPLAARMQPTSEGLEITVASSDAVFPVTIDPVVVRLAASFAPPALGPIGPSEDMGQALAVAGDLAVVGVPYDEDDAGYRGAIYVFAWRDSAWHFEARLRAPDSPAERVTTMGFQLAIAGGEIYAAAPGRHSNSPIRPGFIQVFSKSRGTWKAGPQLRSPDTSHDYEFAGNFAVDGSTLVVSGFGNQGGRLWYFARDRKNWLLRQVIDTPHGISRMAMKGTVMATEGSGGVDIYEFDGSSWEFASAIEPEKPFLFVSNLAVSNGQVLFAARMQDEQTGWKGGAFLCRKTGGQWQATEFAAVGSTWVDFSGHDLYLQDGDSIRTYRLDPDPVAGPVITVPDRFYHFATTFAAAGNRLIVAGILENGGNRRGGGVHAFERSVDSTWLDRGPLNPGFNGHGSLAGGAVATTGAKCFVGAPGDANPAGFHSGSVYVLRRTKKGWQFESRLTSPRPMEGAFFGQALAAIPGRLVVGTSERPAEAAHTTIAHVFSEAGITWPHEASLENPFTDKFGGSDTTLATCGNRVLVGMPHQTANGRSGCAVLFSKSATGWAWEHTFAGSLQVTGNQLGRSVALTSDTVWVATSPSSEGRVHGYQMEGGVWTRKTSVTPPSATRNFPSKTTIALSGDQLWVASSGHWWASGGIDIYQLDGTTATLATQLTAASEEVSNFGTSVAVSGDLAAVLSQSGEPKVSHIGWFERNASGWAPAGDLDLAGYVPHFPASAFHGDSLVLVEPDALTQPFPGETVMQGLAHHFRISGPMPDISVLAKGRKVASGKTLQLRAAGDDLLLEVANVGDARLTEIDARLEGVDASSFVLTSLPAGHLLPGERTAFGVRVAPGSTALKSAKLVIASNDADENPCVIHLRFKPKR